MPEERAVRPPPLSEHLEVSGYLEQAQERAGQQPWAAIGPRPGHETVVVLDFGSQYSLLIARRVRELNVYCEVVPWDAPESMVTALEPRGYILSGGPASVYEPGAPFIPSYILKGEVPVLGICYGMQALAHQLGGQVEPGTVREYGPAILTHQEMEVPLFVGLPFSMAVWMSHGDRVTKLPPGFRSLAYTENSPVAVMGNDGRQFGLQFHPEVVHTPQGRELLRNFLYHICGCQGNWTSAAFTVEAVERIRQQVGQDRVLCALSGGVDSAVTAALIHQAVGEQLTCIFVDNGLLRRDEREQVLDTFRRHLHVNVRAVEAAERFLTRLAGVVDPEAKRKAIGEEFIRVFEAEAANLGRMGFLAQGTLYPDVIESTAPETRAAARIKTHHNVGGLPSDMTFTLIEPLRYLFKDEVRQIGLALGLPEEMVWRHPFPGPGLAIRIIGEVTWERLETLRAADAIVMEEVWQAALGRELWQAFAVLTPIQTVGVTGDHRTYGYTVALRAVTSEDAMTADWAHLPYEVLGRISSRIVNEVPNINRVVYDITSKPPGTIEWE